MQSDKLLIMQQNRRKGGQFSKTKKFGELDFEKMLLNTNLKHPRLMEKMNDGVIKFKKVPWCISIGLLTDNLRATDDTNKV